VEEKANVDQAPNGEQDGSYSLYETDQGSITNVDSEYHVAASRNNMSN